MAQNYTLMARKNLLKPSEAPKYYAVARSGRKVTVKEVCKRITERSSYSKGELEGCIGEFLLEIVNVLDEGNIVQMGDLGNFRMTLGSSGVSTIEEFNTSLIRKPKVAFYPGKRLQETRSLATFERIGGEDSTSPTSPDSEGEEEDGGM